MPGASVSVIVPAHNGAQFYDSAIDSILLSWRPENLEIIVVDDGSTDDLQSKIENRSANIRYFRAERQRGPAAARNIGIRAAMADWIAFLDIDDIWTAGHLARLAGALETDKEAGFAQALVRQFVVLPDGYRLLSGAYRLGYLGSCVFRRWVFEQCGLFDENMEMGEDYDFMFRCWENDVPKRVVDEVSLLYRRHAGNMTRGKNRTANLAVLLRRVHRIRSGAIDPAAPRRFPFADYMGDVGKFAESELEMPEQWNLSLVR